MNVAVVNTYDPKNVTMWSGISFHLCIMFEKVLGESKVNYVTIPLKRGLSSYIRGYYYNRFRNENYLSFADAQVLKLNKSVYEEISKKYDLIITFEFFLVPLLKRKNNKVIYWNDATFKNLQNFYSYTSNLSSYTLKNAHQIQKKAFDQSDAIIFSSEARKINEDSLCLKPFYRGSPSIVINDVNGFSFKKELFVNRAIECIAKIFSDGESYNELCWKSINYYKQELTWNYVRFKFEAVLQKFKSLDVTS